MDGDRHGPQRRPGKHHHDHVAGDPAAFGHELGLTRMREADRIKLRLGHGARDQSRRGTRAGETDRNLKRVE